MMEFVEISADNAEEFEGYIDEDLAEDLDRAFFKGIGAVDGGTPAGALVYELINSESEEDTKSRIRLLAGRDDEVKKELLKQYSEAVSEDEVTESFYEFSDEALAKDLSENGFSKEETESLDLVVTVADIKKLAAMFKNQKTPAYIQSISDTSVLQFRTFIKNCLFKGTKGIVEDLAYLPKTWYETEASACVITDDEVTGAMLLRKSPSGVLIPELYTAYGPDYQKNLALLLSACVLKVSELYPDDTKVVIRRHNDNVSKLTGKLFAGRKGDMVFCGTRAEG